MGFYITSTAACKPPVKTGSTGTCPADWRRWWASESIRIGTNWRCLSELHWQIVERLRANSSSLWAST